MKLFKAIVLVQVVSCNEDCCVDVSRINAEVFARDEDHAREVVSKLDPRESTLTKVELLEDKGEMSQVENPGVLVGESQSIYVGLCEDSPFHGRPFRRQSKY